MRKKCFKTCIEFTFGSAFEKGRQLDSKFNIYFLGKQSRHIYIECAFSKFVRRAYPKKRQ